MWKETKEKIEEISCLIAFLGFLFGIPLLVILSFFITPAGNSHITCTIPGCISAEEIWKQERIAILMIYAIFYSILIYAIKYPPCVEE
ncbi:hypothetical protein J7J18_04450 [bacterium]|nr:hypothetical protein [bacterium]